MADLRAATATELVAELAAGTVSSVELLEASLARVARFNGELNAVVALDAERAMRQAQAADTAGCAARAAGEPLGPLHGLPMTVKDVFETEGLVTTSGAPELAGHVPARDADAVARLRTAGAVIFGKSNVPLYGGDFQTFNDVYGLTRNPWNTARTPGGSSGGGAAAVAAGLSTLELGSDVAGSIRCPSHYCGVFGHMPTWSAVPTRGHIPGPPGSLAALPLGVVGPIGRSAADLDRALGVLVGPDLAGVPGGTLPPPAPGVQALAGCRVGVWLDNPLVRTDREVLAVLAALVDTLADAGAVIEDRIRPPRPFYDMYQTYLELLLGVLSPGFPEEIYGRLGRLARRAAPDDTRPAVLLARGVTQSYRRWLATDEHRAQTAAGWRAVFERVDVVLTPVAPLAAFPHQTDSSPVRRELPVNGRRTPYFLQMAWVSLANLARLPATAVPAGLTSDGLPVGAQIIGPQWMDRSTLAFAGLVEALTGGFRPPPGY